MSSFILVLLSLTAVTVNSDKPLYKAIGDKVVLTPDSVPSPITIMTWKHGPDIAVEWYNGQTQAYRHFEGRITLNNSNGELTITGLTPDDSGSYTAEINNTPPTKPTQLQVISPVSKPSVSTWCHPDMTYCTLTCEGNTTDAEPITYKWKASDMVLDSTRLLNITEEKKEPLFGCILDNPVSSESSEDIPNPFNKGNPVGVIISIIVGSLVVVTLIIGFICYKRKKGQGGFSPMTVFDTGTEEESSRMLPNGDIPLTSVVSLHTNTGAEVPETQTQDSTSPESTETSKETEVHEPQTQNSSPEPPETGAEVPGTQTQDSTSPESGETSKGTDDQETHTQDSTVPESTETSKETEVHEPQTQNSSPEPAETNDETEVPETETKDSTVPESTETSKGTEVPQTQDPTPVGSSDTSDETEKPSEISETSDQDPTSHASKETENSAVVSGDQETVGQEPPVDEQAAEDPKDDDQS